TLYKKLWQQKEPSPLEWKLQVPCILRSRLDHILGNEKRDFYRNLVYSNHKLEISSSVSCLNHGKLVDVHVMCEECIFSFAKNELNEETYRILVAKLEGSVHVVVSHRDLHHMCRSCSVKSINTHF
ncbi:Myosin-binding protein 1, partial [Bienertia sinuspersici]